MAHKIRGMLLPEDQRRTLEELTSDLDLRTGNVSAKRSSFWTMLTLSALIASAGVLNDSTATVIGAMIIAPLSTPIMGIALAIAKRESNRAGWYVAGGVLLVVFIGGLFSLLLPAGYSLLDNAQIAGRVSPAALDMLAALATGLAGAGALARRDVAAVLPGVAIAISLVPPLAVVGVCLGAGDLELAFGAMLLFVSNLLALVLAGTVVFTVLGYAEEAIEQQGRSRRRAYTVLSVTMVVVLVPLVLNSIVTYGLSYYASRVDEVAREWVAGSPGARVTAVDTEGLVMVVSVQSPGELPPTSELISSLEDRLPDVFGVRVKATDAEEIDVRDPSGD